MSRRTLVRKNDLRYGIFCLSICFFLIPSFAAHSSSVTEHTPSDGIIPKSALVKVLIKRSFQGVFLQDRFIPQPEVQEVSEFNGVVVNASGHVVTFIGNYGLEGHQETEFQLRTYDGEQHPAQLLGVDSRISVMVLESNLPKNLAIGFSPDPDVEHFNVATIGNGGLLVGTPCVRSRKKRNWIPVDQLGVSGLDPSQCCWAGGIALDLQGGFIGIVTETQGHQFSKKLHDLYILPAAVVESSLHAILTGKKQIPAGWLGVTMQLEGNRIKIDYVYPESPADRAGIQPGDVIVSLDQQKVDFVKLVTAIRWKGPGTVTSLVVERNGSPREIPVTLGKRTGPKLAWTIHVPDSWGDQQLPREKVQVYRTPLPRIVDLGFVVDHLNAQLAKLLKSPRSEGLLVKEIRIESAAEKAGFQAGDILFWINGYSVLTLSDVQKSIEASKEGMVEIRYVRAGKVYKKSISLP